MLEEEKDRLGGCGEMIKVGNVRFTFAFKCERFNLTSNVFVKALKGGSIHIFFFGTQWKVDA